MPGKTIDVRPVEDTLEKVHREQAISRWETPHRAPLNALRTVAEAPRNTDGHGWNTAGMPSEHPEHLEHPERLQNIAGADGNKLRGHAVKHPETEGITRIPRTLRGECASPPVRGTPRHPVSAPGPGSAPGPPPGPARLPGAPPRFPGSAPVPSRFASRFASPQTGSGGPEGPPLRPVGRPPARCGPVRRPLSPVRCPACAPTRGRRHRSSACSSTSPRRPCACSRSRANRAATTRCR